MSLTMLLLIGLPVLYCWPRVLRFTYRLIADRGGRREAIQLLAGPRQEVRYPRFYRYSVLASRAIAVVAIAFSLYVVLS